MSTGTGTQQDPIVAMSADPAQIARDIRASLAHFGRTDDAYYLEKETTPAEFSNHLWHLGHNRYWETTMEPTDTGSRNPADGRRPALYVAFEVSTGPVVVPPVAPSPDTIASMTLAQLFTLNTKLDAAIDNLADLNARVAALEGRLETLQTQLTTLSLKAAPPYRGSVFGVAVTLTPVVPK